MGAVKSCLANVDDDVQTWGENRKNKRRLKQAQQQQQQHHPQPHAAQMQPQKVERRRSLQINKVRHPSLPSSTRIITNVSFQTRYQLDNKVMGTGLQGVVRVATHKSTGRKFAVKTIRKASICDANLYMLRNEIEILLRLDHPNIVRVMEVYEDEENVYIVMELCTGGELFDRLMTKGHYLERDAADVTRQMLNAIAYIHQHNICHRDLKLENFLYENEGADSDLKLIDFGFSKIFTPGIPMTAIQGTSYYVSPEVLRGRYSKECDIWSIGVITYMLLSGKPPFAGKSDAEILARVEQGVWTLDEPEFRMVSANAKDFLRRVLVVDPAARLTAEQALRHPWIVSCQVHQPVPTATLSGDVLRSMKRFAESARLKRAALSILAYSLSDKDIVQLELVFKAIDKDHDGLLSYDEFEQGLSKLPNMNREEIRRIFTSLDQTNSGYVHYSEFLAAAMQARIVLTEPELRETFQKLDQSKSGRISADDLRNMLGDTFNGMKVEEVISEADRNGDGYVDYDEFLTAFKTISRVPEKSITGKRPALQEIFKNARDTYGPLRYSRGGGTVQQP